MCVYRCGCVWARTPLHVYPPFLFHANGTEFKTKQNKNLSNQVGIFFLRVHSFPEENWVSAQPQMRKKEEGETEEEEEKVGRRE